MNISFWILHIVALFAFWPALFVTIPLHLIARVAAKKQGG